MNYIEELEKRKKYLEKQNKELQDFKSLLVKAVDKYLAKKYAPLEKALADYGNIGEVENAYGCDIISKAKYRKIMDLYEEQQTDTTCQYMEEVLNHLKERIKNNERDLLSVENHIAYEKSKV